MGKIIRIKSSSTEEIYNVTFKIESDLISLDCDCQAGTFNKLCKHRVSLIERNYDDVLDKNDAVLLYDTIVKMNKSEIIKSITEVNLIEKEVKKLNTKKEKLKKDINLKFSNGF